MHGITTVTTGAMQPTGRHGYSTEMVATFTTVLSPSRDITGSHRIRRVRLTRSTVDRLCVGAAVPEVRLEIISTPSPRTGSPSLSPIQLLQLAHPPVRCVSVPRRRRNSLVAVAWHHLLPHPTAKIFCMVWMRSFSRPVLLYPARGSSSFLPISTALQALSAEVTGCEKETSRRREGGGRTQAAGGIDAQEGDSITASAPAAITRRLQSRIVHPNTHPTDKL